MGAAGIPDSVRQLVDRCITSVEQLELLLLLRRDRDRAWSADDAARKLHTAPGSARTRLDELAQTKLALKAGDTYRYGAEGAADAAVAELERLYSTHRTRIISMIFEKPPGAVRDFADAFRLRKDR